MDSFVTLEEENEDKRKSPFATLEDVTNLWREIKDSEIEKAISVLFATVYLIS